MAYKNGAGQSRNEYDVNIRESHSLYTRETEWSSQEDNSNSTSSSEESVMMTDTRNNNTFIQMNDIARFSLLLRHALQDQDTAGAFRNTFKPLIVDQTKEIKGEMEKMKSDINKQEKRINNLEEQVQFLLEKTNNNTNKEDLTSSTIAIEEINNTVKTQLEIIQKTQETNSQRQKTIILHGVEETEEKDVQKRIAKDVASIKSILTDLNVKTTVTEHSRLGRFNKDNPKPRLLKVCVDNTLHQQEILKKSRQLPTIMITPDRSKEERDLRQKLRNELAERKAKGETNLVIRNNEIITKPAETKKVYHKEPFSI